MTVKRIKPFPKLQSRNTFRSVTVEQSLKDDEEKKNAEEVRLLVEKYRNLPISQQEEIMHKAKEKCESLGITEESKGYRILLEGYIRKLVKNL